MATSRSAEEAACPVGYFVATAITLRDVSIATLFSSRSRSAFSADDVGLLRLEAAPEQRVRDADERTPQRQQRARRRLESVVVRRDGSESRSPQLIREIVVRDRVDVPGRVSRIVARHEQRVEQHGEPGVQIPHARVQVQHVRRAHDRDAAGLDDRDRARARTRTDP